MNKKIILYFIFALFLLNIVYAQDLVVRSEPIRDLVVLPSGKASFELTVSNYQDKADKFEVVYPSIEWTFTAEPVYLSLASGGRQNVRITLEPKADIATGVYDVPVVIYSINEPKIRDDINLRVRAVSTEDLVGLSINTLPTGLDPRKESLVQVKLKNRNDIKLKNIKLNLESELFKEEGKFDFDSFEEKTMEFTVTLPPGIEEGIYDVRTTLYWDDNLIYDKIRNIKVGYYSNIKESKSFRKSFLKSITIVERSNDGNSISEEDYSIKLSRFEKLFTSFEPEPSDIVKKDGVYGAMWTFELSPQETFTIEVVTNYRIPLILIIVVLIIIYLAYVLGRNEIRVTKKILTIKSKEGISDMKVLLIIKNRGKNVTDVKVIDQLPHLVKAPIHYGTLKPSKIKKGIKGLNLIWEIPTLLKGEERILSYRVKSDVHVIGRLVIPRAAVKYRGKKKRYVTVLSNRTTLFS